jgi:hypothetical protein
MNPKMLKNLKKVFFDLFSLLHVYRQHVCMRTGSAIWFEWKV